MTLAEKIILAAIKQLPANEAAFNVLKRRLSKGGRGPGEQLPAKTELLTAYHSLLRKKSITRSRPLEKVLTRRAVRTLSGVTIVTSLVKPYPCPGQCVYCPLDERMPKSYLADEPAATRALSLRFNPYEQVAKRIEALENNGHPTDKIELIIKGGTWNAYPLGYQYWFVLESFRAANEGIKHEARNMLHKNILTETSSLDKLRAELKRQQKINEKARHRIIGLTLETRPDCINYHTIWQMRQMGCTRVEMGVQHTDDTILKLIKRGHSAAQTKTATELLKNFGFKTDFHLMPQLPGATPETDLAMLKTIFADPGYRPDMIKIYPCSVVKGAELYDWFKQGQYHAYPTAELIRVLTDFKTTVPRYCRISRLIRDIPGQYIETGNKVTNLRQVIQEQMKKEGRACRCLRCREVGHVVDTIHDTRRKAPLWGKTIQNLQPTLFVDEYATQGGMEYFLSFEDADRQMVFGFCRLRILDPSQPPLKRGGDDNPPLFKEGSGGGHTQLPFPAYIRELHTYGQLISINQKIQKTSNHSGVEIQHGGLGKKLVREAERIAKRNKIKKLAVISGVGVRDYYRKLGYRLEKTYMVKKWK